MPYKCRGVYVRVVVKKKQERSAVGRNRSRRRLSEAIRAIFKEKKVRNGNLVVFASKNSKTCEFKELKEEMNKVFINIS